MPNLNSNFLLILINFVVLLDNLNAQSEIDCLSIKTRWHSQKYPYSNELNKFTPPKSVDTICPKSTCCDSSMKTELVGVSQQKMKAIAKSHLKSIIEFLYNNSKDLNEYFQNNLDLSRNQLHQMFTSTYSNKYKANQPFFFDFYEKLKRYMDGKEQNIEKILETFFHDMAEKILTMMESEKKSDPETIRCLTNNFLKQNPYQNADKTIISNIKSAYPVARMFVNGLRAAHDLFLELIEKMMPSAECATEYAKAFYCSQCSGTEIMPCDGLCKSVMGKCFGSFNSKEMNKFNKAWKAFLVALDKISKRLKHPFNYSEINKNLHVKISDAIMNVHTTFPSAREKTWENCKIQLSRERRESEDEENQYFENMPKSLENIQQKSKELSEIIDKFSAKMSNMTQHLQKYKISICSNKFNLPKQGNQCWNGIETTTSVYKPESKDKNAMKNLPINPLMKSSIAKLKKITDTLNNLLNNKNADPETFKIKFVEKPKVKEIPRPRPSRISEASIEGSGKGGADNENTAIKPKPELPIVENNNNINNNNINNNNNNKQVDIIEGSGKMKSLDNENEKNRPEFPQINNNKTPKPETTIKPTAIPDDEDLAPDQNENEKVKTQKPFEKKKPLIEGSGSVDSEKATESIPSFTKTTTITTLKPLVIAETRDNKVRRPDDESSLPEGSGEETPPKPKELNPKIASVPEVTTTTPVDTPTQPVLLPNDLPGEIPSEIWIPRVVDYDSRGQLITKPDSAASNTKTTLLSTVFLSFIVILELL